MVRMTDGGDRARPMMMELTNFAATDLSLSLSLSVSINKSPAAVACVRACVPRRDEAGAL